MTNLIEQFLNGMKIKELHEYKKHLRIFSEFCSQEKVLYTDFSGNIMTRYKSFIVWRRDAGGVYVRDSWITHHFIYTACFFSWLKEKGFIENNPFKGLSGEKPDDEISAMISERRLSMRKKNSGSVSGDRIFETYKKHVEGFYKHYQCKRRFRLSMQAVKEFAGKKGKTVFDLEKKDVPGLMEHMANIERYPSQRFADLTLENYYSAIRIFFRWMYEEGYTGDNILSGLTRASVRAFIKEKRQKDSLKIKSRQYSVKEILRTFDNYLKKTVAHYSDISRYRIDVRFFLRFLLSRNRTFYNADKSDIEAFKKHLMDYEYLPGVYYTASGQGEKLRLVKRFYDWFVINGHRQDNPLNGYEISAYTRSIAEKCRNRYKGRKVCHEIPEAFRNVYEGASKHYARIYLNPKSILRQQQGWRYFFSFLDKAGIQDLKEVDERVLNDYQAYIPEQKNTYGIKMKRCALSRHLIAVKRLFQYLARFKYLPHDPSVCIQLPKMQRGLPTCGMNDAEVRRLIDCINIETQKGIRDRTMVEVLYSTGVRANELRHIRVRDMDFQAGMVRINVPKGGANYQRVIPIGRIACEWVLKYLNEVKGLHNHSSEEYLFTGKIEGKPLHATAILAAIKGYLIRAGIKRHIVTHSFRVSCATGMLRGDADIKHVQEQLGHVSIQSTEKYLRLLPKDLKEVHKKTHPREKRMNPEL